MNLGFGERVQIWHTLLIREDTGRQAGDDFGHIECVCGVQDVIVDEYIVPEEGELLSISTRPESS